MFNTEDEILRRLQEKNLEMAVMFYHWCQRNHLTCYLCGGGCIGAIRHGGFIPWDDDLDFFMPRKDYEKFLKIWDTQEESKIYKLEYPKEGFCNAHTFANIRDSRTTQVKKEQVDMDLCHGVALDILPIEGYAPGNLARKWQVIEGKIFQLFCTQVIPTKERHGAFMHYLGTILLALAPTQKMRYRIWKQAENYITKFDIDSPRVDGITEMYMGHFMIMSREAYEGVFGEGFESNAALVKLADGSLSSVEERSAAFMRLDAVKSVVQNTALEDQVNTVVNSLDMIMTVLILVATMLAVVIMYNLTNLNVSERMRELSTIKVLGFHSNETTMYIYRETILLTILGVLAGYVMGVALHQYILNVVPPDTVMFNPELSAIEFAVPAVVIAVITVVLYFVELRRLTRVDMLEALKSVE